MRRCGPLLVTLAAALAAAGCDRFEAPAPEAGPTLNAGPAVVRPPPAPVPSTVRPLAARDVRGTWRVTRIDGQPPVSSKATVTFHGDTLTASAGCNRYDALLTVQASRLAASAPDFRPMSTEAACTNPEGAQEGPLFSTLVPGAVLGFAGAELVIRAPAGREVRLLRP